MKPESKNIFSVEQQMPWFERYFRDFRDLAPKDMVEWGGYQSGTVTPMASSLESVLCFLNVIDINGSLLNAGAGASSWIFRKLMADVACTDNDSAYLEAVKKVCAAGGLNTDNFIHPIKNTGEYDYTYYDYGNLDRIISLQTAFDKTRKMMYVDDTDTRESCKLMRDVVYHFAKSNNAEIYDMPEAIDQYGRWGVILVK